MACRPGAEFEEEGDQVAAGGADGRASPPRLAQQGDLVVQDLEGGGSRVSPLPTTFGLPQAASALLWGWAGGAQQEARPSGSSEPAAAAPGWHATPRSHVGTPRLGTLRRTGGTPPRAGGAAPSNDSSAAAPPAPPGSPPPPPAGPPGAGAGAVVGTARTPVDEGSIGGGAGGRARHFVLEAALEPSPSSSPCDKHWPNNLLPPCPPGPPSPPAPPPPPSIPGKGEQQQQQQQDTGEGSSAPPSSNLERILMQSVPITYVYTDDDSTHGPSSPRGIQSQREPPPIPATACTLQGQPQQRPPPPPQLQLLLSQQQPLQEPEPVPITPLEEPDTPLRRVFDRLNGLWRSGRSHSTSPSSRLSLGGGSGIGVPGFSAYGATPVSLSPSNSSPVQSSKLHKLDRTTPAARPSGGGGSAGPQLAHVRLGDADVYDNGVWRGSDPGNPLSNRGVVWRSSDRANSLGGSNTALHSVVQHQKRQSEGSSRWARAAGMEEATRGMPPLQPTGSQGVASVDGAASGREGAGVGHPLPGGASLRAEQPPSNGAVRRGGAMRRMSQVCAW